MRPVLVSAFAAIQRAAIRTLQIHVGLLVLLSAAPALAMWSIIARSVYLLESCANLVWIGLICSIGVSLAFGADYLIRGHRRRSRSLPRVMKPEDVRKEVEAVLYDIIEDSYTPADYLNAVRWRLDSLRADMDCLHISKPTGDKTWAQARAEYDAAPAEAERRRIENLQLAS